MNLEALQHPQVTALLAGLPPLPSSVRYYDDFFDKYRSIRHLGALSQWPIVTDGETHVVDFSVFGTLEPLAKRLVLWQILNLDPTTVALRSQVFRRLPQPWRENILCSMLTLGRKLINGLPLRHAS